MTCNLCESSSEYKNLEYKTTIFKKNKLFEKLTINFCFNCGLGTAVPYPKKDDLDYFYLNEYRANKTSFHFDFKNKIRPFSVDYRSISQLILALHFIQLNQGDVFADLGPGSGVSFESIVDIFGDDYVECWAIEYSEESADYYKKLYGVDSHIDLSQMCLEKSKKVDLLLSSHSLEHFSFTGALHFLNSLQGSMSAKGCAIFEVPHIDLRVHSDIRGGDDPHLLFFSKQSLVLLFEKCGFDVLFVETCCRALKNRANLDSQDQRNNVFGRRAKRLIKKILQNIPQLGNLIVKIFAERSIDFRDINFAYGGNRECLRIVVRPKRQTLNQV